MAIDPYANCNPNLTSTTTCTLQTCCLAQSSFNYLPSLGGNLFLAIFFGLVIVPQLFFGIKYKTWSYMGCMIAGLVLEVVGYVGRVWLHESPWNNNAFLMYFITITIAPVFFSAAIYLCLTRIVVLYGAEHSRIKPKWIAIGFMTSDFFSLVLQGTGGGIVETADHGSSAQHTGLDIMVAGLVLQCISLALFILVVADFGWRCRSHKSSLNHDPRKVEVRNQGLFKAFMVGLMLATVFILTRSIYRAIELWAGFSGSLWNKEVEFMVLDGAMIAMACVLLSIFHPGQVLREQWHAANWRSMAKAEKSTGEKKAPTPLSVASEDGSFRF